MTQGHAPTRDVRRFCREVGQCMTKDRDVILQEAFATIVAGVLCWEAMRNGFPVVAAILALSIGTINTLTLADFSAAVRQRQARQRDEYTEDQR